MDDKTPSARERMLKGLALRVLEAARALDAETEPPVGVSDEQRALNEGLLDAISEADAEGVKSMLRRGADANARDKQQRPALIIAARALRFIGPRLAVFEALLSAGADSNQVNAQRETALMQAALAPNESAVARLLAAGADPESACSRGFMAIHGAARSGAGEIVQALINAGSSVNKPNDLGETPLMMAAEYDHELSVRALLAAGADVGAVDNEGATALDLCRRRNGERSNCEAILTAAMEARALWRETRNPGKSSEDEPRAPGLRL